MNPSDDERERDEYRRASAEEAGRPGAAVRKAILAEAAAAAKRRTPAANDSRYLWRGLAGVAVLGVAVLMWKQVDHRLPGETPVASPGAPDVLLEAVPTAAPAETKTESLEEMKAPRSASAAADAPAIDAPASPAMANAMQAAPAPAAPAPAQESLRREPARALGKMSAAQDAEVDAEALLRREFPQQFQSESPHSVWLVQDAAGAVLRSGELASGETFSAIRPQIEGELGAPLRPWRIRSLRNARGQIIEFGIAQTP